MTTSLRHAVVIALIAIFGLGPSAIPAVFAGTDRCHSSGMAASCCCGVNGDDCGCGGSCCGGDEETRPVDQGDEDSQAPAVVCLCGFGDSVPAVPSNSPVSVQAFMRASADCVVEILDLTALARKDRGFTVDRCALAPAATILRL